MLYISTQVSRKRLRKIRQIEFSGTLPHPAPMKPGYIANFVLDGCGLTHAGANLQGFGNVGDGAGPLYASTTGPGSSGRFANAGVATTQSRRMPKQDADQINDEGHQIDSRTNKRSTVAKWAVSEAASARFVGTKPNRSCKSNDVFDGDRRDVDERTRRDLDESDTE